MRIMHINKDKSVFHQNCPIELMHTRVSFVCKECAQIKSSVSADYVLNRHVLRISLLVFIIQWVHTYLLVSGYASDWILSSVLEDSYGPTGERFPPHDSPPLMQVLPEVGEALVGAGDILILMTLCLPTVLLRISDRHIWCSTLCLPCFAWRAAGRWKSLEKIGHSSDMDSWVVLKTGRCSTEG